MSTRERVAVRNAADPEQVRKAEKNDDFKREEELNDIIAVLNYEEGRRLIWRFLCRCNIFSTVKRNDSELTHMAIGEQNIGQWLLSEITEANADLLFNMMKENMKQEEKKDAR